MLEKDEHGISDAGTDRNRPSAASSESWPPVPDRVKKSKLGRILFGTAAAIGLIVGLYLVNSRWIAPVTRRQVKAGKGNSVLAPDFSLSDLNGQKVSLADYKGKVVLLDFWATWCEPCRAEVPELVRIENRYHTQGLNIIGVSLDDGPEPVRAFYKKFQMNYPVVLGNDKLSTSYGGLLGLPTAFLIGRDGRIYSKHAGATSTSVFEQELQELLAAGGKGSAPGF